MERRGPAVSVVLPTWNRMRWLPDAVASVRAQTFADLELVVVDDASTDGTPGYLASLGDPRVRVVRLARRSGPARARNAGAAAARGDLLAFLDSDDLWLPRKLEAQVEATRRAGAGWSYTAWGHADEEGRPLPPRAGAWRPLPGRIALPLLLGEAGVTIVTVLLRRDLFEALGGFSEAPGIREDVELLVRLALRADAHAVDERLAVVREHASRSTRALRGAEPFLVSARTYGALLPALPPGPERRAARRRRAALLADACAAALAAGDVAPAAASLARAVASGASPWRCLSAVRRGLGVDRSLLRRLGVRRRPPSPSPTSGRPPRSAPPTRTPS